jgi:Spy/CpxP family protein refolding chaperone
VQVDPSQGDGTLFAFLAGVDLTAAQKASIQAIAERNRPPSEAAEKARSERFVALLSADTLDETALAAFFRDRLQATAQVRAGLIATHAAVREVLTPAQRTAAAAAIQAELARPVTRESPPPAQQGGEPPREQLTLSAEQQTLFAATVSPPPDPRAILTALATLMRTGDKAGLEAALAPKVSLDAKVTALVKAFASLTPTQRKQMVGGR